MANEEDRERRRCDRHRNLVAKYAPRFNKPKRHGRKIYLDRQEYKKIDLEDW